MQNRPNTYPVLSTFYALYTSIQYAVLRICLCLIFESMTRVGFFSSSAIPSQDGCIAVSCTIVADFIYFGICVQL